MKPATPAKVSALPPNQLSKIRVDFASGDRACAKTYEMMVVHSQWLQRKLADTGQNLTVNLWIGGKSRTTEYHLFLTLLNKLLESDQDVMGQIFFSRVLQLRSSKPDQQGKWLVNMTPGTMRTLFCYYGEDRHWREVHANKLVTYGCTGLFSLFDRRHFELVFSQDAGHDMPDVELLLLQRLMSLALRDKTFEFNVYLELNPSYR